jgi:hypothetical protein
MLRGIHKKQFDELGTEVEMLLLSWDATKIRRESQREQILNPTVRYDCMEHY